MEDCSRTARRHAQCSAQVEAGGSAELDIPRCPWSGQSATVNIQNRMGSMAAVDISDPILNSPYGPPDPYFELGPIGKCWLGGPSESFIPIPQGQKGNDQQQSFDFTSRGGGSRTR